MTIAEESIFGKGSRIGDLNFSAITVSKLQCYHKLAVTTVTKVTTILMLHFSAITCMVQCSFNENISVLLQQGFLVQTQ